MLNTIILILLFGVAISLFIFGHNIEGNLGATTWVYCIQVYTKLLKK